MDVIADNCLLSPTFVFKFVKLFTPDPPDQFHVVSQATVVPLTEVILAHCEPVAPLMPHWSSSSEYWVPAAAVLIKRIKERVY